MKAKLNRMAGWQSGHAADCKSVCTPVRFLLISLQYNIMSFQSIEENRDDKFIQIITEQIFCYLAMIDFLNIENSEPYKLFQESFKSQRIRTKEC